MDTGYGFIMPGFSSISKATGAGAGGGNVKPLKVQSYEVEWGEQTTEREEKCLKCLQNVTQLSEISHNKGGGRIT